MTYKSISVEPVTPHVGAEITNVDLTVPLSNAQVEDIHQALAVHGVLFFRDQAMDLEMLKRLGRHFGELHIHSGRKGMSEHPEIRPIYADSESKHVAGEGWHTDLSCEPVPPMGSILHMHVVPPAGGDTLFASMYAAYDALSPKLQSILEGLTATHDGAVGFAKYGEAVPGKTYPVAVHPIVARHPVTGRKLLFVNSGFTLRINELSQAESDALLAFLYAHLSQPDFQARLRWRPNSVAFWDNRCTQHKAIWDYFPHVRSGFRVQIKGTQPPLAAAA